ncbi:signal recognition particle subunit SRP72-like [Glossina fuscipes fuscipes]
MVISIRESRRKTEEAANWVMSTKAAKKSANAKIDQSPGTPVVEKKKCHKRKRKSKLPKNYNAEIPPDPERWLPKYERTGFRKRCDHRAKDIIKGSQGMSSQAAEQYDMSNRANGNKSSPATPAYQEPTPGPHQPRPYLSLSRSLCENNLKPHTKII